MKANETRFAMSGYGDSETYHGTLRMSALRVEPEPVPAIPANDGLLLPSIAVTATGLDHRH